MVWEIERPKDIDYYRHEAPEEEAELLVYGFLFPNDRLVLNHKKAVVHLQLRPRQSPKPIRGRKYHEYVVSGDCRGPQAEEGQQENDLLAREMILAMVDLSLPTQPVNLGPTRSLADRTEEEGPPPLVAFKRLPAVTQKLPVGLARLSTAWSGASGRLLLFEEGPAPGEPLADSPYGNFGYATLDLPPLAAGRRYRLAVESGGTPAALDLEAVAAETVPPVPPEVAAVGPGVAALWLYRNGPPEWRLYAQSLLADLADSSLVAERGWLESIAEPDA